MWNDAIDEKCPPFDSPICEITDTNEGQCADANMYEERICFTNVELVPEGIMAVINDPNYPAETCGSFDPSSDCAQRGVDSEGVYTYYCAALLTDHGQAVRRQEAEEQQQQQDA